jgi:hypothetical protein
MSGVNKIFLSSGDSSAAEPAPQAPASLLSDKVYVECKNGFAAAPRVKMSRPLNYIREDFVDVENAKSIGTPLELAILVQKWCRPLYTLCHGLLGGMALLHVILVSAYSVGGPKLCQKLLQTLMRPVRM